MTELILSESIASVVHIKFSPLLQITLGSPTAGLCGKASVKVSNFMVSDSDSVIAADSATVSRFPYPHMQLDSDHCQPSRRFHH